MTEIVEISHVVEQLEEEQIVLELVRWAAGEGGPHDEQKRWVDQLRRDRGDRFYSDLLFALVGHRYPSLESRALWDETVKTTLTEY